MTTPDDTLLSFHWRPIGEYLPEMGRVVVWLCWTSYVINKLESLGEWQAAYTIATPVGAVWVEAKDCVPIETAGRKITHFAIPRQPK